MQGGHAISRQHRIGHHFEEVGVGPADSVYRPGLAPSQRLAGRLEPGHGLHLWEIQREVRPHRPQRAVHLLDLLAGQGEVELDAVDVLIARDEPLEAVFVSDIKSDHDRRGEADGEAEDGDPRVEPVAAEVAEGGGEVVAQHGPLLLAYSYRSAVAGLARATSQAWVETVIQAISTAATDAVRNSQGGRSTR